jgi:hypothetical protein
VCSFCSLPSFEGNSAFGVASGAFILQVGFQQIAAAYSAVQLNLRATRPMTNADIIDPDYLILSWRTLSNTVSSYLVYVGQQDRVGFVAMWPFSSPPLSTPCLGIDVRRAAYRDCDGRRTPMLSKGHVSLHRDTCWDCLSIRKLRPASFTDTESIDRINL